MPLSPSIARLVAAVLLTVLHLVLVPRSARGDTLEKAVPAPLQPWVHWVLDGTASCPPLYDRADSSHCAWPSRITLSLDDHGGTFVQSWHLDALTGVPLPGDAKRWPIAATVDGRPARVVTHGDAPFVEIGPGDHAIQGRFTWDSLPESLAVPKETGLLALTLHGKPVVAPTRDAQGTVWFQKSKTDEEGDSLGVVVHRKVVDDIPVRLITRIELHVSGKSREELLGRALPPDFVPLSLETPLPARVEADGRIRVQLRPGVFTLELVARAQGPVSALTRPVPGGPWKEGDEVWVFESKNDYRVVSVTGVPTIDPQQTALPDGWKRLPAYAMSAEATMRLVESRRGDSDPAPDQLTLRRSMWLDFDGQGYTVRDDITGALNRSSRLTIGSDETKLGRVAVGGRNQFITTLSTGGKADTGVEVRLGEISVTADSRVTGRADIPAVGWAHDFREVSGTLHLPPGWTLLYASGVDDAPEAWIRRWTLALVFLGLVISIALGRLFGRVWGAVACAMLVLALPEAGAPGWVFIPLLAIEGLFRVLPEGRARKAAEVLRVAGFLAIALMATVFAVKDVQRGLHPMLAHAGTDIASGQHPIGGRDEDEEKSRATAEESEQQEASAAPAAVAPPPPPEQAAAKAPTGSSMSLPLVTAKVAKGALQRTQSQWQGYDTAAVVQTGPGLPRWSWASLRLTWSGPVLRGQRLHLYLLSPVANLVVALLRSALVLLVVARLFPGSMRRLPRLFHGDGASALAVLLVGSFAWFTPAVANAQIPDKAMLDELKGRLQRPPSCSPTCASVGSMSVELRESSLRLRLDVAVAAPSAIALPGTGGQWTPSEVFVDGRLAKALVRVDDLLWVALEEGTHQVVLEGPTGERAQLQLSLPMKPHHVVANAVGWTVTGLHEDGLADNDLAFTRTETSKGHERTLQPGVLPPFLVVTRTLHLGLEWEVDTDVTRASPVGTAIAVEVPLLPGERVTTADQRVTAGRAELSFRPDATSVRWHSILPPTARIRLSAPKDVPWTEVWRMDVGTMWHADYSGIPFVHGESKGEKVAEWRPWPGEEATVTLVRPEGVAGQSLTIDKSITTVEPGLRATDVSLDVELRSSRGGDHTFTLPEGAELESAAVNGVAEPMRQEGRKVTFSVTPATVGVRLKFRIPVGISTLFVAPAVDVGAPNVNATLELHVPNGRWLLFLNGPAAGPAILFWPHLLVLFVVALALGRTRSTPLRTWQWALLFVGLSQVPIAAAAVFVGWLLALGERARDTTPVLSPKLFNLRQLALALWTLAALGTLAAALGQGLLGTPEMQVSGNASSGTLLRWFVDRSSPVLTQARMVSVPLMVYRGVMLAWALWIALSLLAWIRWGWTAYSAGAFWMHRPPRPVPPPLEPPPAPPTDRV